VQPLTESVAWVDRPGPIGSLQEQQYYWQREQEPVAPLTRVRRLLREIASDTPDRILAPQPDALGGHQPNDHEVSRLEVLSALTRLSPADQHIIELAFLRSWERRAIAQQMDCVERTVYRRIARGLVAMAAVIWDYAIELPGPDVPDGDGQTRCRCCGIRVGGAVVDLVQGCCPRCWQDEQKTC